MTYSWTSSTALLSLPYFMECCAFLLCLSDVPLTHPTGPLPVLHPHLPRTSTLPHVTADGTLTPAVPQQQHMIQQGSGSLKRTSSKAAKPPSSIEALKDLAASIAMGVAMDVGAIKAPPAASGGAQGELCREASVADAAAAAGGGGEKVTGVSPVPAAGGTGVGAGDGGIGSSHEVAGGSVGGQQQQQMGQPSRIVGGAASAASPSGAPAAAGGAGAGAGAAGASCTCPECGKVSAC